MTTPRLLVAVVQPSLVVAWGIWGASDVRVAFLLYVFVACGVMPWVLVGARPGSRGIGLPFRGDRAGFGRGAILHLLAFGPAMVAAFALLRPWMGAPEHYQEQLALLHWNPDRFPWYATFFVLLVPLMEEWWWRGQALPRCVARFGTRGGVALTAMGFAAYHAFVLLRLYDPLAVALRMTAILGAGVFWTALAHREGRWGLAYLGHLAADISIVVIFLLFFRNAG